MESSCPIAWGGFLFIANQPQKLALISLTDTIFPVQCLVTLLHQAFPFFFSVTVGILKPHFPPNILAHFATWASFRQGSLLLEKKKKQTCKSWFSALWLLLFLVACFWKAPTLHSIYSYISPWIHFSETPTLEKVVSSIRRIPSILFLHIRLNS